MRRFLHLLRRHCQYFQYSQRTMDAELLKPPVLGNMIELDKDAFKKTITVPCLKVGPAAVQESKKLLKPVVLKLPHLPPLVRETDSYLCLLNPHIITSWTSLGDKVRDKLAEFGITHSDYSSTEIELNYNNWNADDILRSVLPKDLEIARGFSQIGHIIHLNLRDHHLKYRKIIGEILLDKIPNAKTVVNKSTVIDNTFRNFQMELICGDDNMITTVRENGIAYEFDFSKVYWNPRLSTEHARVTDTIKPGDVLFDVFCGVGPFAIPCAKKKCKVFANDLNPESFKWLNVNIKRNKVNEDFIKTFNKDGAEFIKKDLKENLKRISEEGVSGKVYVTMNLPALALEFIKHFRKLFSRHEITEDKLIIPSIYVYFFVNGSNPQETAKEEFEKYSGLSFDKQTMTYQYVRNVSPKKDMVKITFTAPASFFIDEEPPLKKICDES